MNILPRILSAKKSRFGLVIGRDTLRAVELDFRGKVNVSIEVPFADTVFNKGVLVDKTQFVSSLQRMIRDGHFSSPYVTVCFSEGYAYSREYDLPELPLEEIHEAVAWKVKDLFPFPEEELYFDWKILSTDKTIKVGVMAVQKKILNPLIEAFHTVKLKPISFQPGASAIATMLSLKIEEQALLIDLSKHESYVTLVEGEKSLFTSIVPFTSSDTSSSYLANITQTISETVRYYMQKGILKQSVPQIILSGELATTEWAKALAENVQIPVKILNTSLQNPSFNTAFAAARGIIASPYDIYSINLLPTVLQKTYNTEQTRQLGGLLITQFTVLTLILFSISIFFYLGMNLKQQTIEGKIGEVNETSQEQTPNTQVLLQFNAQAKKIVELDVVRDTPVDDLITLKSLVPEGIGVNQISYNDSKLLYTLAGTARERDSLLLFRQKLEQSGNFTKVILPLETLETPENISFTISFIKK
ncbi:hypothetical protein HY408_00585 [Candidatus Gottesmanbacteria bacterium]|nr:hypothetical protein [Candidatus Gottesmanbacteria bacterium]